MKTIYNAAQNLNIVGPQNRFPKVTLMEPTGYTYILVALEIDHRLPFFHVFESGRKKQAVQMLKSYASQLTGMDGVRDATVFKALLSPPGKGEYLAKRPEIDIARFDLVMLVEVETTATAKSLRAASGWQEMEKTAEGLSRKALILTADNPRMIGPVDHTKQGVFLFNFFYADDIAQNLGIWEYTAGWFTDQTGLDNSCLLAPAKGENTDYTVINHCRWDRLMDILPSIIFKRSFKTYVENNFNANRTAPIPILYKRA